MKHILIIGILALVFGSCDSFLKEYSRDLARVKTVADLEELLIGDAYYQPLYLVYDDGYVDPQGDVLNPFIHFMTDELVMNPDASDGGVTANEYFGYITWQYNVGINPKETNVRTENTYWKKSYSFINVTNMILAELDEIGTNGEDEEKDRVRVEGEARFLRALYYFTLVNLYAEPYVPSKASATPGVPLKLTSYIEDKEYESASLEDVYGQITKDLERAAECLSVSDFQNMHQADINAVNLLLSRVYLYMQDYTNACKYAQAVIDKKPDLQDLHGLEEQDNVVSSSNPEVIFSMGGDALTQYLYYFEEDDSMNPFFLSDDLVNAFDDDDLRKRIYIQLDSYEEHYLYKKIFWGVAHYGSPCSVSDNFCFRSAEAYLNFAEAAALDGKDGEAHEKLGALQAKRFESTPDISGKSGDALVDLIREERQRELCLEGHRWFDLRRYTVCEKRAFSKEITHMFYDFRTSWPYGVSRRREYKLEKNDPNYTLAFPKEVLEFQSTLGQNNRKPKPPVVDTKVEAEE